MVTSPFNPYVMTNAAGSFNITSTGYWQGMAMDNPAARQFLDKGVLAATETLPMFGGVGISELIPGAANFDPALGGPVGRATTQTVGVAGQLTGFSVFDQNASAINSPLNPVPLSYSGMQVNFYRLGCGVQIPVAMDPSLVSLEGEIITTPVSWDFVNQRLQPFVASGGTFTITSATWANTNGGQLTVVTSAAVPFGVGDTVTISGATNSGTGGAAAINTSFVIASLTDTEHFVLTAPAAAGVFGTIAGTPVVSASVGALPVRVKQVQIGNSVTVSFNPTTGIATWNRNDSVALIII